MFKSERWKTQNSKKVMFQMQFQATQVPKLKGKGLMISLIPADIGKPIARLEKVAVVEGNCTWEDPIYEMVKLTKHQKTKTYKEKIYNEFSFVNINRNNYQDQTHGYAEASKNAVEVLKSDVSRLARQAELSELELESFRKQMQKENKRGQDLSRKIAELREEKEALKTECDQLKSVHKHIYKAVPHPSESPEDLKVLLDQIREELKHEKNLNKSLKLHLHKTEESNSELLFTFKDLDRMMEEKNTEMSYLSEKLKESQMANEAMSCKRDHEEEK